MLAVNCAWFNVTQMNDLFEAEELRHGIHGGAVETSLMLHLHPELVKTDRAKNFVSRAIAVEAGNSVLRIEGSTGIGWQTQDLNEAGACGDATAADASRGKILLERAAQALVALAGEVSRHPAIRLSGVGGSLPT
jgi:creatinine amidohydrolase